MFRLPTCPGMSPAQACRLSGDIAALIHAHFDGENGSIARLDRWTRQRIVVDNQARLLRILQADDLVETCIANLVDDIDREAEFGVLLTTPAGLAAQINRLNGEAKMSGRLFQYQDVIAPILFRQELARGGDRPEIVWTGMQATFDRANLDAEVSELILINLLRDEDRAADIVDSIRAHFYAYHEDRVRCRCRLPRLLDDQAAGTLRSTVSALRERARLQSATSRGDGKDPDSRLVCC